MNPSAARTLFGSASIGISLSVPSINMWPLLTGYRRNKFTNVVLPLWDL